MKMLTVIYKKQVDTADIFTFDDFTKLLDSHPVMDRVLKDVNNDIK
jgi:hypothetical protein